MIERLQADVKTALKSGDKARLGVLRMTLAELKNAAIRKREELDEGDVLSVIQKDVKKHEESAEAFRSGARDEQAAAEDAAADILREYLPSMLSEAELEAAVDEAIAETGAASKRDMGRVMKEMMSRHSGRVDGKAVQALVASKLP